MTRTVNKAADRALKMHEGQSTQVSAGKTNFRLEKRQGKICAIKDNKLFKVSPEKESVRTLLKRISESGSSPDKAKQLQDYTNELGFIERPDIVRFAQLKSRIEVVHILGELAGIPKEQVHDDVFRALRIRYPEEYKNEVKFLSRPDIVHDLAVDERIAKIYKLAHLARIPKNHVNQDIANANKLRYPAQYESELEELARTDIVFDMDIDQTVALIREKGLLSKYPEEKIAADIDAALAKRADV